jgi:hypothetical protein
MATTAKELIAILEKYTEPDEVLFWQYYTRHDFALDEPALTKKQFERVAEKVERYELWTPAYEAIQDEIYKTQSKTQSDNN